MYLKTIFITFLILTSGICALNWIIDPYRIFNSPELTGINIIKPKAQAQIFLNRAVAIQNHPAKTVLLGNSRTQWGLHASSPFWPDQGKEVINLAIPGSNMNTSYEYLKHASHYNSLETVIVGVDYYSFLTDPETLDKSPAQEPRVIGAFKEFTSPEGAGYTTYLKRLLSLNVLMDSIITIKNQNTSFSEDITIKGDNPVREYNQYVHDKGHHKLFSHYIRGTEKKLKSKKRIFNQDGTSQDFESLKNIINFCKKHKIKLIIYIHPYHTELIKQLKSVERWQEFIDWKKTILSLIKENTLKDVKPVELWDFSIESVYTTETIPPLNDKREMQWYWEPGHYKKALGDEMIKVFLNGKEKNSSTFGQKIISVSDINKE